MGVEAMLDVPRADVSGGFDAASRLSRAATLTSGAVQRWDATAAPSWAGEAAVGFDAARVVLSRLVRDAVVAAEGLSRAVRAYAAEMEVVLPRWRAAVDEWERARAGEAAAADPLAAGQAVFDAELVVARWHGRAETAGMELSAAAAGAVAGLGEYSEVWAQVDEGLRTFVRLGVVEPVQAVGFLALGWVWDRDGWTRQGAAMVDAAGPAVEQAARHPWDTFRSGASAALGVEHFQAGRWGAGLGTVAAGAFGFGKGFKNPLKGQPVDADTRARFPSAAFDRNRPLPRTQTVDEMLVDGVDLDRHEHADLGHALRRHVNVTDDYLEDRVTNGTILDDFTRADYVPGTASAWNDRATAQASIDQALHENEAQVRAFAVASFPARLQLNVTAAAPVGRSMWFDGGTRHIAPVANSVVFLKRTPHGVVVESAYPEPPK